MNQNGRHSALPDRLPPQSVDAESAAIGSALISKIAAEHVTEALRSQDHYFEAHRRIQDVLEYLVGRDSPVDLLSVSEELRKRDQLDAIGGTPYLMTLAESVPTAAHVEHYTRIVSEKATARALISAGSAITSLGYDDETDTEEKLHQAAELVAAVGTRKQVIPIYTTTDLLQQHLLSFAPGVTGPPVFPTGLWRVDEMLPGGGFSIGEMSIIAGRPGSGKSALCTEISMHMGSRGYSVGVLSMDMSGRKTFSRYLSAMSDVPLRTLLRNGCSATEWQAVMQATVAFDSLTLTLVDEPDLPVSAIEAVVRRMIREHGLQIVIVDQLQCVKREGKQRDSEQAEWNAIVQRLAALPKRLNIHLILVCQLNRNNEKRAKEDRRPILTDLRETGALEHHSRVVLGVHREAYYERQALPTTGSEPFEIIFMKNTDGVTGTAHLQCELARCRVWDPNAPVPPPAQQALAAGDADDDPMFDDEPPPTHYGSSH